MGTRIRNNPDHVYEVFCEIGIPVAANESAWITWKYPHSFKDEETLKSIPEFAYPVEFDENAVHHFSFVLTNVDSKWTFGFCRHAPNASTCLVLLSYLPWHEVFYRILNHIAELCNNDKCESSEAAQHYLEALFKTKVPDPGLEICVNYDDKVFTATIPDCNKLPSIPENRNITEYFNAIDAFNMITIFASMLHERRILVVSKKLSRLSACVQAANSLIYPMHWQHIFIPVLPRHLLDYLCAPMPFLIGVPASTFTHIKHSDMGDVVILQADENVVLSPFADSDALPSEVLQSLRQDLKRPHEMIGDCVARAFLRASVKLIGGYWNALKLKPGEKISFSPEMFVQTRPAPMQPFLEKMLELQIFQQFIESRLKMLNSGQGVSDVFEFELTAHEDKASTRLRNQYRDWVSNMKKEGGAFIKNVRIKVKDTSKKAYKDIRSRMNHHHHHKMIKDEISAKKPGFRERGNSVPILFPNGLEVPSELCNGGQIGEQNKDETADKGTADKSNLTLPLSETKETNSNSLESPMLTFEPIDMDLMDDFQEYFLSSCSLYSGAAPPRNSISDPQLSDLSVKTGNSSNPFKNKGIINDDTPPPLLPRPPSSKSFSNQSHLSSSSAYSKEFFNKPLIELDDGKALSNSVTNCDSAISLGEDNGNLMHSAERNVTGHNPFNDSFVNSNVSSCSSFIPTVQSTNPFYSYSRNSSSLSANSENSGPNVRNIVNMWQSSNITPPSVHTIKPNHVTTSQNPNVAPYRSQPILRTSATPSPHFGAVLPSHLESRPISRNPFVAEQDKVNTNKKTGRISKNTNLSWENFQ